VHIAPKLKKKITNILASPSFLPRHAFELFLYRDTVSTPPRCRPFSVAVCFLPRHAFELCLCRDTISLSYGFHRRVSFRDTVFVTTQIFSKI
jgi:hypothetical protein